MGVRRVLNDIVRILVCMYVKYFVINVGIGIFRQNKVSAIHHNLNNTISVISKIKNVICVVHFCLQA